MELVYSRNIITGLAHYDIVITEDELRMANLSRVDSLLLAEGAESNKIADKLLALETVARCIEEANNE